MKRTIIAAVVMALALAACGSTADSVVEVPDVVGQRLSVAESLLDGHEIEVFDNYASRAILNSSNWVVVSQEQTGDLIVLGVEKPDDGVTTTTEAPTTTASRMMMPGSNLTESEWLILVQVINDPEQAGFCDFFETMFLNEMEPIYREGFNETAIVQINELDTLVVLATTFAIHCPANAETFGSEIRDQYPSSTVSEFQTLLDALADLLEAS